MDDLRETNHTLDRLVIKRRLDTPPDISETSSPYSSRRRQYKDKGKSRPGPDEERRSKRSQQVRAKRTGYDSAAQPIPIQSTRSQESNDSPYPDTDEENMSTAPSNTGSASGRPTDTPRPQPPQNTYFMLTPENLQELCTNIV